MNKWYFMICLLFIVSGCSENGPSVEEKPIELEKPVQDLPQMPDEIPEDFHFLLRFGIDSKNGIDSDKGIVTKDLIEYGVATASLSLTKEELGQIYEEMKVVNVLAQKKFIPAEKNGTMCVQEPHEEDFWVITMNGEQVEHHISGIYCDQTKDAKQFYRLRESIWAMVETKEAYRELPEAVGGYD